ncbi:MAG: histidine kinase dimerization/phospho-acceptor domain-containing protein [Gammaproteobacteria bacterium]|nr:histidine kinase dimerization/phospho-acceptor domain-containing protein [Gammaproteobacteria bacterium]
MIAHFSPLTTPDPESDTLIFIEDSTEVQRQAQQLKLASLGRLSATIAHEIRNPLGAISHAAQLLRESDDLSTGDKRLTEIIQNHCVRLNGVIENVLQMSRRKSAEPTRIDLADWITDFLEEFTAGASTARSTSTSILRPAQRSSSTLNTYRRCLEISARTDYDTVEKATGEAKLRIDGRGRRHFG